MFQPTGDPVLDMMQLQQLRRQYGREGNSPSPAYHGIEGERAARTPYEQAMDAMLDYYKGPKAFTAAYEQAVAPPPSSGGLIAAAQAGEPQDPLFPNGATVATGPASTMTPEQALNGMPAVPQDPGMPAEPQDPGMLAQAWDWAKGTMQPKEEVFADFSLPYAERERRRQGEPPQIAPVNNFAQMPPQMPGSPPPTQAPVGNFAQMPPQARTPGFAPPTPNPHPPMPQMQQRPPMVDTTDDARAARTNAAEPMGPTGLLGWLSAQNRKWHQNPRNVAKMSETDKFIARQNGWLP